MMDQRLGEALIELYTKLMKHFVVLSRRSYGMKLAANAYAPQTTIFISAKRMIENVSLFKITAKNEFPFRENSHVTKI